MKHKKGGLIHCKLLGDEKNKSSGHYNSDIKVYYISKLRCNIIISIRLCHRSHKHY